MKYESVDFNDTENCLNVLYDDNKTRVISYERNGLMHIELLYEGVIFESLTHERDDIDCLFYAKDRVVQKQH